MRDPIRYPMLHARKYDPLDDHNSQVLPCFVCRLMSRMIAAVWITCLCCALLPHAFEEDDLKPKTGEKVLSAFLCSTSGIRTNSIVQGLCTPFLFSDEVIVINAIMMYMAPLFVLVCILSPARFTNLNFEFEKSGN